MGEPLAELLASPLPAVWDGGVGLDVCDVADFEQRSLETHAAFYARCFSQQEIDYCCAQAAPYQHFAARFAAKEAAIKALGNITPLAYWQVEVIRGSNGAPGLRVWDESRLAPLGLMDEYRLLVSLTHTDTTAAAIVVACPRKT